jgi:hypothetical protein
VTFQTRTSVWRSAVSQALIVLTAWLAIAPTLHGGGHDPDCDPAVLLHDASQHRMTEATSNDDVHADHCVACHLFRSSRLGAAWRFVPQAVDSNRLALHIASGVVISCAAVPLPARAPPALA